MDTHAVLYTTSQKGARLEREIVEFRNGTSRGRFSFLSELVALDDFER